MVFQVGKKPWEWAWTIDTLSLFIFIMFISHPSCTCVNKIPTNPCWNYGCHLWLSPTPPPPLLPACLCNLSGNQLFLSFRSNMASLVRENSMPPPPQKNALDFLWTFFRTVFARGSITSRCSGKWTRTYRKRKSPPTIQAMEYTFRSTNFRNHNKTYLVY